MTVILWIVLWTIVIVAICRSDGVCKGPCDGCPYEGTCQQQNRIK